MLQLPAFRSLLLLFGLVFALSTRGQTQTPTTPTQAHSGTTEVVELTPLIVTATRDLPPPESWIAAKIPGFDIMSNASERTTKKLLQDFENFRNVIETVWPIKTRSHQPATILFCSGNTFEPFIPKTDRPDGSNDTGRASVTLIGPEHVYIILDLGTPTLTLSGGETDADGGGFNNTYEVDYYRLLYREYIHYMMNRATTPVPAWYEEGVAQIIMKIDIDPKSVVLGKISEADPRTSSAKSNAAIFGNNRSTADGNDSSTDDFGNIGSETISDADFNIALQRRALLGFREFFGVTRDSPVARNPIGNNVWAKQCYAFVHMCMYALPNKYKNALETFVARSEKEPATEALFTECFGKSYNKILTELRGYIDFTSYRYQEYRVKGKDRIDQPPRTFEPLPEGESARTKGDALLLAHNPNAALASLEASYARGERKPDFLATFGLTALATKQDMRARRLLAAAVAGKTTRAAAYPAYAQMLLDEACAKPESADGKHISPAQLATVLEPLFAARQVSPPLQQTYEIMARAWMSSDATPKPENFGAIAEGVAFFSHDLDLVYPAAQIVIRMDNTKAAEALIAHALQIATDEPTREKFAALRMSMAP